MTNKHTVEQDIEVKAIQIPTDTRHIVLVGHWKSSFPELDSCEPPEQASRILNMLHAVRTVMLQEEVDMVAGAAFLVSLPKRAGGGTRAKQCGLFAESPTFQRFWRVEPRYSQTSENVWEGLRQAWAFVNV